MFHSLDGKRRERKLQKNLRGNEKSSNSRNHNKKDFSVNEFILKIKVQLKWFSSNIT
jgi:hypothetical protein